MKQRTLTMWLRGLSIGLFIGVTVDFPSCFPYSLAITIICWVIAGIYQKSCDLDEEQKRKEEEKERMQRTYYKH